MFKWLNIVYRVNIVFVLLLLHSLIANGQLQVRGFLGAGINTYNPEGLKAFNREIQISLPVKAKIISNFPPYLSYSASVIVLNDNFHFGWSFNHSSTGSRITYKDYSGHILFDQRISSNSIATEVGSRLHTHRGFEISCLIKPIINLNSFRINEDINIDENYSNNRLKFKNVNFGIQPGLVVIKQFWKIMIRSEIGYEFQSKERLFLNGDRNYYLINSNKEVVKYDGSGIRFGLSLGIKVS